MDRLSDDFSGHNGAAESGDEVELGAPCPHANAGPDTQKILRKMGVLPRAEFDQQRMKGPKVGRLEQGVSPKKDVPEIALTDEHNVVCVCHLVVTQCHACLEKKFFRAE